LDVVDSLGIAWDSADSEALVIDFIPVALAADAINGVEASNTAALSIGKYLVGSTSDNTESSLVPISWGASTHSSLSTVCGISRAFSANSFNSVGLNCTSAGTVYDVVNLVGWAWNSADLEINIVEGFFRARLAWSLDSEESLVADASFID
jgi:hypothetical protein